MPDKMKHKSRTNRLQTGNAGNKKKTEIAAADARTQATNAAAASFPYPADFLISSEGGSSRQKKSRNRQQARELLHYRQE